MDYFRADIGATLPPYLTLVLLNTLVSFIFFTYLFFVQLKLEASLPASSPILKLSTKDRQDMLAWLDIQRNSEVLAKTDKKIAEKLRNQRLTEKAAKQV